MTTRTCSKVEFLGCDVHKKGHNVTQYIVVDPSITSHIHTPSSSHRITGYSPFQGETHQETFLNVSTVDYDFDDELFDNVSQEAKEFIEKLLIKQPT